MAFFDRGSARIYFEETGQGEPIIAVHGLIENTIYWKLAAKIFSKHLRFISMDMRAHGRTVVQRKPYGFDADTIAEDVIALADHLKLRRFHLLAHSTGGFAAVRHAMKDSSRFATLILTNTSSATSAIPGTPESIRQFHDSLAGWFVKYDWDQIITKIKKRPEPFFRGIMESERSEELMNLSREMIGQGDRNIIATFIRSFYTDPNPRVEGLRKINCPVLIIFGEKDDLFIESSRLMAREIPGARLIMYEGIGHMSAYEAPELLSRDVLSFIQSHPV
jgi:pimeloyl-ACP methyl ester carboxylesterase